MSAEEFVEMEIKVKVPKNTYGLLVDLAKMVGNITAEGILLKELEGLIRDFFDGGYYENWTDIAGTKMLQKHGIDC